MGIFHVDCEVEHIGTGHKAVAGKLLVDTGSELTWLPQEMLRRLHTKVAKKDQSFLMANGQLVTRSTGYVIIRSDKFETVDEVVFAEPGDLHLLGARTLEGFCATVDARRKRLVAAGPHPVAPSRRASRASNAIGLDSSSARAPMKPGTEWPGLPGSERVPTPSLEGDPACRRK